jgi:hypothetical protein
MTAAAESRRKYFVDVETVVAEVERLFGVRPFVVPHPASDGVYCAVWPGACATAPRLALWATFGLARSTQAPLDLHLFRMTSEGDCKLFCSDVGGIPEFRDYWGRLILRALREVGGEVLASADVRTPPAAVRL